MNKEEKEYINYLFDLKRKIDSAIESQITEGLFYGRENSKDLKDSIDYYIEDFIRFSNR